MSSLPGVTLEDFLMWDFNVLVANQEDANFSIGLAEALGTAKQRRPILTEEQFAEIVVLNEPYREQVEYLLADFDEETQSWRDYAGLLFDFIPKEVSEQCLALVQKFKAPSTTV